MRNKILPQEEPSSSQGWDQAGGRLFSWQNSHRQAPAAQAAGTLRQQSPAAVWRSVAAGGWDVEDGSTRVWQHDPSDMQPPVARTASNLSQPPSPAVVRLGGDGDQALPTRQPSLRLQPASRLAADLQHPQQPPFQGSPNGSPSASRSLAVAAAPEAYPEVLEGAQRLAGLRQLSHLRPGCRGGQMDGGFPPPISPRAPPQLQRDSAPRPAKPAPAQLHLHINSLESQDGEGCQLPLALPFPAPSYICMAMDLGSPPPLNAYMWSTPFWMDLLMALAALVYAVMTLYITVLQELKDATRTFSETALTMFSVLYPPITMFMLIVRANEISRRKEVYFVLLRYKIVLDWQNWTWNPKCWRGRDGAMFIPFRSWFFAYWIITLGTLAYWAWFRSTWECIIVVLLQTAGLWRYYQSTLVVENSLLSFNKSLENSDGVMKFQAAKQYLDSGLATVHELVLRQFAACRKRQMPPKKFWFRRNPRFQEQMQVWKAQVQGDLARLPSAAEEDYPLGWWDKMYSVHFLGRRMLSVMRWHPDFAATNAGVGWYLHGQIWPLAVGFFTVCAIEVYGMYYQWASLA